METETLLQRPAVLLQRETLYQKRTIIPQQRILPDDQEGMTIAALEEFVEAQKPENANSKKTKKKWLALASKRKKNAIATTSAHTKSAKIRKPRKAVSKQTAKPVAVSTNTWLDASLVVVALEPQLTLLWRPVLGEYGVAVSLVSLLIMALRSERIRKLALTAAILPVALLVDLSLPQSNSFAQAGVFYATILLLAILTGITFRLDKPSALST